MIIRTNNPINSTMNSFPSRSEFTHFYFQMHMFQEYMKHLENQKKDVVEIIKKAKNVEEEFIENARAAIRKE